MPLATMRQMIGIGETEANIDKKEWSSLLKFQIVSENFDSGYGRYSNRNLQDRFVMKVS